MHTDHHKDMTTTTTTHDHKDQVDDDRNHKIDEIVEDFPSGCSDWIWNMLLNMPELPETSFPVLDCCKDPRFDTGTNVSSPSCMEGQTSYDLTLNDTKEHQQQQHQQPQQQQEQQQQDEQHQHQQHHQQQELQQHDVYGVVGNDARTHCEHERCDEVIADAGPRCLALANHDTGKCYIRFDSCLSLCFAAVAFSASIASLPNLADQLVFPIRWPALEVPFTGNIGYAVSIERLPCKILGLVFPTPPRLMELCAPKAHSHEQPISHWELIADGFRAFRLLPGSVQYLAFLALYLCRSMCCASCMPQAIATGTAHDAAKMTLGSPTTVPLRSDARTDARAASDAAHTACQDNTGYDRSASQPSWQGREPVESHGPGPTRTQSIAFRVLASLLSLVAAAPYFRTDALPGQLADDAILTTTARNSNMRFPKMTRLIIIPVWICMILMFSCLLLCCPKRLCERDGNEHLQWELKEALINISFNQDNVCARCRSLYSWLA